MVFYGTLIQVDYNSASQGSTACAHGLKSTSQEFGKNSPKKNAVAANDVGKNSGEYIQVKSETVKQANGFQEIKNLDGSTASNNCFTEEAL
jgi:hypothetical protein